MNEKTLKDLLSSLRETGKPKTSAYDTTATVTRIENGTAWVHIPGGVRETPVKLTINAKAGDNVQVRVSGGRAFMVGNATAPPTDDHTAKQALAETRTVNKVVKAVQTVAEKAAKIAGNTNQYFWHTESGADTGAHITEIPQEAFLADPANGGGNLLARSNGIAIRNGLDELAGFYDDGIEIGTDARTKILLNLIDGLKLGNSVHIRPSGDGIFTGEVYAASGQLGGFALDDSLSGTWTDSDTGDVYRVFMGYEEPVLLGDYPKCFYIHKVGATAPEFYVSPDGVVGSTYFNAYGVKSYTPTYNESVVTANCSCTVSAGMCSFIYRGANVAHSTSTLLCTLPVGARPTKALHIGFVKNSGATVGTVAINTDGKVTVATISSSTASGRICFNCTYPVV